jgi:dTDP-4-dehydrorhamnose reductase
MKILILGGKGMAGHMIVDYFKKMTNYTVFYTSRDIQDDASITLDVTNSWELENTIFSIKPDIIINCVGILNKRADMNPKLAFRVNSALPHQLAKLAERYNGKLIHISTDCVFSGRKGDYIEDDDKDGTSVYAKTKQYGEIISDKHLTIRTSIIGPELKENGIGLFLWFMKQEGIVKGYDKVFWNGVTTLELAKAIDAMIKKNVTGLYQLGAEYKISKYELLKVIKNAFGKPDVEISKDTNVQLDRTIISTREDFYYKVPSYPEMISELKEWMDQSEHVF